MKTKFTIAALLFVSMGAFGEECTLNGVDDVFGLKPKSIRAVRAALSKKGFAVVSDRENARFRLFFRNIEGGPGQAGNRWRGYNAVLSDYGVTFMEPKGSAYASGLFVNYETLIRRAALDAIEQLPNCPGIIEHANPN